MNKRFETLNLDLKYPSKRATSVIAKMWRRFYARIDDPAIDRAIWICNQCPPWIGVKPGSPVDDPYDNPQFVLSVFIPGLEAISSPVYGKDLPEEEIMAELGAIFKESYAWLRSGIYASWNQVNIQKLHAKKVSGKFAVYTSEVGDVETDNFALMDWLCGDKLN